jgi:hypothetical protein
MTTFNGYTVINRGNSPSPISPAKLDFFFVKDGSYIDPYQVCSVHIFPDTEFGAPDNYLDLSAGSANYGLVSSTANNMVFHNQKVDPTSVPPNQVVGFDGFVSACDVESFYDSSKPNTASGIFRTGPGQFSVLLQTGTEYWSTSATSFNTGPNYENNASSTGGYIDIWTVVDAFGSAAQIYVNQFALTTANVFATTEPLAVTTYNKLIQRYVDVGSKKNLQIKTELVVDSEPMAASLRNLMEQGALVQNPEISVTKLNETPGMTSRVQITGTGSVGGFTKTGVRLDSHGTISYIFDTTNITPFYEDETLGGPTGVYEVQVKYNLLDETILSPKFKLIVR